MKALETRRLLLRPPMLNDLDDLAATIDDPGLARQLGFAPLTADARRELLQAEPAACLRDGVGLFSIVDPAQGHVVGLCGLRRCELGGESSVIVICAIDPGQRRRGFATEALAALRPHAAQVAASSGGLCALVETDDAIAQRLAVRAGLVREDEVTVDDRPVMRYRWP